MTSVLDPPNVNQNLTDGVLLNNISWATYESLLRDHPDAASPRFTYDRGKLLITVTSPKHEEINRTLNLLIELLAEEFAIESRAFGSTTFKREDLQRGFEPDSCFYFENEPQVRGRKNLDLSVDPPPDLVVEIDISRPSLNKLPLFAAFGIPEVWRFNGKQVEILILQRDDYVLSDRSLIFSPVSAELITSFVDESLKIGRLEWIKKVREWARSSVS